MIIFYEDILHEFLVFFKYFLPIGVGRRTMELKGEQTNFWIGKQNELPYFVYIHGLRIRQAIKQGRPSLCVSNFVHITLFSLKTTEQSDIFGRF